MGKQNNTPAKTSLSRLAKISKRARTFFVLSISIALVGFVVLPLLYNGYLFSDPVQEEVHAAAAQPTPSAPVAALVSTPFATPTARPSASPTPAQIAEITVTYPTLQQEDNNDMVATMQARLMELGYFDYDEITTYFGAVTKSAVELFQRTQGLAQTGIADSETLTRLYSENVLPYQMRLEDKGTDVRSLQRRLTELGYYEEKDNGYFGVATQRAVYAFQKRNTIEETGIVDQNMRSLLYSPEAKYLVDPTPKPTKTPSAPSTPKPSKTPKPTASPAATKTPVFHIPEEPFVPEEIIESMATPKPTPKATSTPVPPSDSGNYSQDVDGFIAAAKAQLGKPYVWSDEGPDSFDCSGLVYYCLRQAGISVGRYDSLSYSNLSSWESVGSLSKCKKGDILFYKSDTKNYVNHMGIYLGGGKFLHASSSAGKVVISDTINYYERNFVIARRVF